MTIAKRMNHNYGLPNAILVISTIGYQPREIKTQSGSGLAYNNHTPITNTRTITPQGYLQQIPQSQIDATRMHDAVKKAYRNPG